MIFDSNYYQKKKAELDRKTNGRMAVLIQNITNLMSAFYNEVREADERRKELNEMEAENKKLDKDNSEEGKPKEEVPKK